MLATLPAGGADGSALETVGGELGFEPGFQPAGAIGLGGRALVEGGDATDGDETSGAGGATGDPLGGGIGTTGVGDPMMSV